MEILMYVMGEEGGLWNVYVKKTSELKMIG